MVVEEEAARRLRLKSILNAGDFLMDKERAHIDFDRASRRFYAVRSEPAPSAAAVSPAPASAVANLASQSSEDEEPRKKGLGRIPVPSTEDPDDVAAIQARLHYHRLQEESKSVCPFQSHHCPEQGRKGDT